jgi:hypothetical protein
MVTHLVARASLATIVHLGKVFYVSLPSTHEYLVVLRHFIVIFCIVVFLVIISLVLVLLQLPAALIPSQILVALRPIHPLRALMPGVCLLWKSPIRVLILIYLSLLGSELLLVSPRLPLELFCAEVHLLLGNGPLLHIRIIPVLPVIEVAITFLLLRP